jgi:hypothetical protein
MTKPDKIVKMTDAESAEFRRLRDAAAATSLAFRQFENSFKLRNQPRTRQYAPFEKIDMHIFDQPGERETDKDGGTYAYFGNSLE